jgi:hypothetical protein
MAAAAAPAAEHWSATNHGAEHERLVAHVQERLCVVPPPCETHEYHQCGSLDYGRGYARPHIILDVSKVYKTTVIAHRAVSLRLFPGDRVRLVLCESCADALAYGTNPCTLAVGAVYFRGAADVRAVTPAMLLLYARCHSSLQHAAVEALLPFVPHLSELHWLTRRRVPRCAVFQQLGGQAVTRALDALARTGDFASLAIALYAARHDYALREAPPDVGALPAVGALLDACADPLQASAVHARHRLDARAALAYVVLPRAYAGHCRSVVCTVTHALYPQQAWSDAQSQLECALIAESARTGMLPFPMEMLRTVVPRSREGDMEKVPEAAALKRALDRVPAENAPPRKRQYSLHMAFARLATDARAAVDALVSPEDWRLDARAEEVVRQAQHSLRAVPAFHRELAANTLEPFFRRIEPLPMEPYTPLTVFTAQLREQAALATEAERTLTRAAEHIERCRARTLRAVPPLAVLAAAVAAAPENVACTLSAARLLAVPKMHVRGAAAADGRWALDPPVPVLGLAPAFRTVLVDHVRAALLARDERAFVATGIHDQPARAVAAAREAASAAHGDDGGRDLYGDEALLLPVCAHADCGEVVLAGGVVCAACGVVLYCGDACMAACRVAHTATEYTLETAHGTISFMGACAALRYVRDSRVFAYSALHEATGVDATTARLAGRAYRAARARAAATAPPPP